MSCRLVACRAGRQPCTYQRTIQKRGPKKGAHKRDDVEVTPPPPKRARTDSLPPAAVSYPARNSYASESTYYPGYYQQPQRQPTTGYQAAPAQLNVYPYNPASSLQPQLQLSPQLQTQPSYGYSGYYPYYPPTSNYAAGYGYQQQQQPTAMPQQVAQARTASVFLGSLGADGSGFGGSKIVDAGSTGLNGSSLSASGPRRDERRGMQLEELAREATRPGSSGLDFTRTDTFGIYSNGTDSSSRGMDLIAVASAGLGSSSPGIQSNVMASDSFVTQSPGMNSNIYPDSPSENGNALASSAKGSSFWDIVMTLDRPPTVHSPADISLDPSIPALQHSIPLSLLLNPGPQRAGMPVASPVPSSDMRYLAHLASPPDTVPLLKHVGIMDDLPDLPEPSVLRYLVQVYFETVHKTVPILHEPSFWRNPGSIPHFLIWSLAAAAISTHPAADSTSPLARRLAALRTPEISRALAGKRMFALQTSLIERTKRILLTVSGARLPTSREFGIYKTAAVLMLAMSTVWRFFKGGMEFADVLIVGFCLRVGLSWDGLTV